MAGFLKTAGTAFFAALVVPIGCISGIAAAITLLIFIFSNSNRTSAVFLFFVVAATIFFLAIRFLLQLARKATSLVKQVNGETGLSFNDRNLLGHPSPVFIIFDTQNQKLAICNSMTQYYKLHDLSYLLSWSYEWTDYDRMVVGAAAGAGAGTPISGTVMQVPGVAYERDRKNFILVLEVADENNPILKFPMSERSARVWCAKLNAIVNG